MNGPLARIPSAVPVGGSPTGAGESPAPPIFQARSNALKTLAYRYRLRLTPAQEDMLDRSQEQLRLVWNHWVRSQRHAERESSHGRAASVKNEMLELSLAKKATGQALVSARKIALERGVSEPEALGFRRQEFVEKVATIPKRKKMAHAVCGLPVAEWRRGMPMPS